MDSKYITYIVLRRLLYWYKKYIESLFHRNSQQIENPINKINLNTVSENHINSNKFLNIDLKMK